MPEYQIRPIGRPKVERASNGLRKITRRYVVQGEAVAAGNIESQVFLAFGTVDAEYASLTQTLGPGYESGTYTSSMGAETINAYLVQQAIEPSEEVTQAFLTRVYQELDATPDPVQVDKDTVQISDSGKITLQRKFIVKNPYIEHYDPSRIGVDSIEKTHTDSSGVETTRTLFLGKVESKENEVFTEFTETFFEDSIMSISVEYRNGLKGDDANPHRLEIRTIRAIKGAQALENPAEWQAFTSTQSLVTTYGMGPGEPEDLWYLVSEREGPGNRDFGQGGKPLLTKVWAKGAGVISVQRNIKHGGVLEIVNVRSLGAQSSRNDASDMDASPQPAPGSSAVNGVTYGRISESVQESGGHRIFNDTYVAGRGRISKSVETKGPIEIVTETWVTPPGGVVTSPPTGLAASELENIFSESLQIKDGYELRTISGTSAASGIINVRWQYKHFNGASSAFDLEICTITKIGAAPTPAEAKARRPTPNNTADFVIISEQEDESGRYVVFTSTLAAGKGEIQTSEKNTGSLTVNSFTSLNTTFPSNTYDQSTLDRDGYIVRSYKTYDLDSDFTSNPNESKQWLNKHVYRQTTQTLTETEPDAAGAALATSADDVSGSYSKQVPGIWRTTDTDVTVSAEGVISESVRYNAKGNYFQITKVVASESGTTPDSYAPDYSCLISNSKSYERGWVRDQFTWIALASNPVITETATTMPWTIPGVITINTKVNDPAGSGNRGVIRRVNPQSVQLGVVKRTTLQLEPPSVPEPLKVPWAGVDAWVVFNARKDPYIIDDVHRNWVYQVKTTSIPMWDTFNGFNIISHDVTMSGVEVTAWNNIAGGGLFGTDGAALSAHASELVSDGDTTIWKMDVIYGSPVVDVDAAW